MQMQVSNRHILSGIVIFLVALVLGGCAARDTHGTQAITIAGERFELEIAATPTARFQGLSDRSSIARSGGMLFVFPAAAVRTFVMRRCLVPIDIVFLAPNGRIVAMYAMQVEPYGTPEDGLTPYSSRWPAQYAIELRGGTIKELGIKLGEKIAVPGKLLKRLSR